MGETPDAIRNQIDQQRHQLEDNLEGIEGKFKETSDQVQQKVKNATDWRHQFDERPMLGLGIAFGGGMLLASMLGGGSKDSGRQGYSYQPQYQSFADGGRSGTDVGKQHVSSTMDNIKGALLGVAAAQAKTFLEESVPSFGDEYRKVEREHGSGTSQKQASDGMPQASSYPMHASDQQGVGDQ